MFPMPLLRINCSSLTINKLIINLFLISTLILNSYGQNSNYPSDRLETFTATLVSSPASDSPTEPFLTQSCYDEQGKARKCDPPSFSPKYGKFDTLEICKCNGHASDCRISDINDPYSKLMCVCEHNTTGINCERCHDLYNDQKYEVATFEDAHECQPCNCNNRASKCVYDADLWAETGHGGRCVDCINNTDGPNCERCKEGFYENNLGRCVPCGCSMGSIGPQCSRDGQCICRSGISGEKCDRCKHDYYNYSPRGCMYCECGAAILKDSNKRIQNLEKEKKNLEIELKKLREKVSDLKKKLSDGISLFTDFLSQMDIPNITMI